MKRPVLTRTIVLNKATEIAHQKGISGLTYNGLARALSVQPQSLYRLVDNIADVKINVISNFLTTVISQIKPVLINNHGKEGLRLFAQHFTDLVTSDFENSLKVSDILIGLAEYGETEAINTIMLDLRSMAFRMFEEISNNEEQNKLNAALFFNIIIGYIALMSTGIQPSDAQQIFIRNINRVIDSF